MHAPNTLKSIMILSVGRLFYKINLELNMLHPRIDLLPFLLIVLCLIQKVEVQAQRRASTVGLSGNTKTN